MKFSISFICSTKEYFNFIFSELVKLDLIPIQMTVLLLVVKSVFFWRPQQEPAPINYFFGKLIGLFVPCNSLVAWDTPKSNVVLVPPLP